MAATFPTSVRSFSTKVNVVDTVDASHPNSVQEEVIAIESVLGTDPATSTAPSSSGTFTSSINDFVTIKARLANIETGIVADTHTQYVKIVGGSTITSSTNSVVGLIVKGASGQTANLQEWKNNTNSVVGSITAAGELTVTNVTANNISAIEQSVVSQLLFGGM
jgi:hypothetical protein